MAHFIVLILLPPDTSNINEAVQNLLYPYYSELEVDPYREYLDQIGFAEEVKQLSLLSQAELEKLALDWEVSTKNLEEIAKLRLDWYENEVVGTDQRGPYRLSTINPRGKWNSYTLLSSQPTKSTEMIHYPCRVEDLREIIPYAVITPDGEWHDTGMDVGIEAFKRDCLNCNIPISEQERNWDLKVQEIFSRYPNHIVVGLNCHL